MTQSAKCPLCAKEEIDDSGVCPACGFRQAPEIRPGPASRKGTAPFSGLIAMDCSGTPGRPEGELPPWRQELSQRLRDIRKKRGLESAAPVLPFDGVETAGPSGDENLSSSAEPAQAPKSAPRRPRAVVRSQERPAPRLARPLKREIETSPLFQSSTGKPPEMPAPAPEPARRIPTVTDPDPGQVQSLIDSIMARQSGAKTEVRLTQPPARAEEAVPQEGGLILLSRTLSGLVDILIVGLIAASFIIAADVFAGIDVFDVWSRVHLGILVLAVFFLYSVFFLGAANQTVGMMIKDLRVVAEGGGRPRISQVFGRSVWYLLAFLPLGAGLISGCFSRRSLCLHDQLSRTYVTRL